MKVKQLPVFFNTIFLLMLILFLSGCIQNPSDLEAVLTQAGEVELSWIDKSDIEEGFIIEKSINGSCFQTIETTSQDVSSFTDTNVTANTVYLYRVYAFNADGKSCHSNTVKIDTSSDVPTAPDTLAAVASSSTSVSISWNDNSVNETSFVIEQKTAGGDFTEIASVDANTITYTDTSLSPSTEYTYRIKSVNSVGSSAWSDTASATTEDAPGTEPEAPDALSATAVSQSGINLTWIDNSDNEEAFIIERMTNGGAFQSIGSVDADVVVFSDERLNPSTEYIYRVSAVNSAGSSAWSDSASATTEDAPGTEPEAPDTLSAAAVSQSGINLTWIDNSDNEEAFIIERMTASGAFQPIGSVDADVVAFSDERLNPSTEYIYRVSAVNSAGSSAWSDSASATTEDAPGTGPEAPSTLSATSVSQSGINLTWIDNSDDEEAFIIERMTASGAFQQIGSVDADVVVFSDERLNPSTEYIYRVSAVNSAGSSAWSDSASATTEDAPGTVPEAPYALSATAVSQSGINLTWRDNSDNEEAFIIERMTASGDFQSIGSVDADVVSFSDERLDPSTEYMYRISAVNTAGSSPWCDTASATTHPGRP